MVLKPEPIFEAVRARVGTGPVILLSPQGRLLNQAIVRELATHNDLYLICGRYEGVDERVSAHLVNMELSIGDYVLTGGELPAMVVIDAVSRLVTGVLGSEESPKDESFAEHLLEYPHYTRPAVFEGHAVPEVLLSGLELCRPSGRVSVPDALIWAMARAQPPSVVYTFDRRFPAEGIELREPV